MDPPLPPPLGRRPYWARSWVAQETQFSRKVTVYCGGYSTSWGNFDYFARYVHESNQSPSTSYISISQRTIEAPTESTPMIMIQRMVRKHSTWKSVLQLREIGQRLHCCDPRDQLFRLLGLLALGPRENNPLLDYSRDCQKLYTDIMRRYLYVGHRSDILQEDTLQSRQIRIRHFGNLVQSALGNPFAHKQIQHTESNSPSPDHADVPYSVKHIGPLVAEDLTLNILGPGHYWHIIDQDIQDTVRLLAAFIKSINDLRCLRVI